jgi:cytochrome c peroxidase
MPRTRLILLAAIFATLLTTSCHSGEEKDAPAEHNHEIPPARAADEAAIRAASAAWSQASSAQELDKAVSFYADDAVQFPEKAPPQKAKKISARIGPGCSQRPAAASVFGPRPSKSRAQVS